MSAGKGPQTALPYPQICGFDKERAYGRMTRWSDGLRLSVDAEVLRVPIEV
ncbi:hypothetical protein [Streptomyces sp. NPDC058954]|uniref:hypothetical protein n=1 Tax=Streptomyces sp. NPDC058954 TaxID=3346677 RepID=UPI003678673D